MNEYKFTSLEEMVEEHWIENFTQKDVELISHRFNKNGMVVIKNLVPKSVISAIKEETLRLLNDESERRDLYLKTTGGTPRFMEVVRSEIISEYGEFINQLYRGKALKTVLEQISGEEMFICPAKDEEFLITRQDKPGDTHGWHWGDYRYALIWILESPNLECGGMLQCVPHTSWNKSNPQIHHYLCENPISTYGFESGDIYLLKSDTTLHRTVPLTSEGTRIMLNMTYAGKKDKNQSLDYDDRWWDDEEVGEAVAE